jgi:probable F420-dependent oxidoreductase
MRVATTLSQDDLRKTAAAARQAEANGFDALLTQENRHDPFLAHAVAATATERIGLGTSVAIAFPRSPMVVANVSWDLQIASRGRFVLGLGPQIRPHNEKRFSVPWSAPAPRMRDYVGALRAIWTAWEKGTKLEYRGTHYTFTLMTPNFVPPSQGMPMVPVTLAAVGEHTLRLAGEVADGVRLHSFCTRRYLEEVVVPRLQEGFARRGRSRDTFEITGGGFVASGADAAAVARAVEFVRRRVAFYGSTPAYWPVMDLHGLGDLARKLNVMSKQGQWAEMTASIPDDVVHLFAAVGTHREIAGVVRQRFGGLVDTVYASASPEQPSDMPPDVLQDIRSIPSPFAGYGAAW